MSRKSRREDDEEEVEMRKVMTLVGELRIEVAKLRDEQRLMKEEQREYLALLNDLPELLPLLKSVHDKVVLGTKGRPLTVMEQLPNKIKSKEFMKEMEQLCPNVDKCRKLLEQGADCNGNMDVCSYTPMHTAACKNFKDIMQILIEFGANPDRLSKGESPIWVAAREGHTGIVQILLNANAEFDRPAEKVDISECSTPLYMACQNSHLDVVRMLLKAGADPNTFIRKEENGSAFKIYALTWACKNDHFEISRVLFESGTNFVLSSEEANNLATCYHWPLYLAVVHRNKPQVRMLVEHGHLVGVNTDEQLWRTIVTHCCDLGYTDIFKIILDSVKKQMQEETHVNTTCSSCNKSPIIGYRYKSVSSDDFNLCFSCHEKGISAEYWTKIESGLLCKDWSYYSKESFSLMSQLIKKNYVELFGIILDLSVMNLRDGYPGNETPIGLASELGRIEIVKMLMRAKVGWFSDAGINGSDAMNRAIRNKQPDVLTVLLEGKCKIGSLALSNAFQVGNVEMARMLLSRGVNVNEPDETMFCHPYTNLCPIHYACLLGNLHLVQLLIDSNANILKAEQLGNTGLHFACLKGHTEIAKLLIQKKQSKIINTRNCSNQAAIHIAAQYGRKDVVKLIIEMKAIIGGEVTALSFSCQGLGLINSQAYLDVATILIDARDDVNKVDQYGLSPLTFALNYESKQLVEKLIKAGATVDDEQKGLVDTVNSKNSDETNKKSAYVFELKLETLKDESKRASVHYQSLEDNYSTNFGVEIAGLEGGVMELINLSRVIENGQAYLTRTKGSVMGSASWKFSLPTSGANEWGISGCVVKLDCNLPKEDSRGKVTVQVAAWRGGECKSVDVTSDVSPGDNQGKCIKLERNYTGISDPQVSTIVVTAHLIGPDGQQDSSVLNISNIYVVLEAAQSKSSD